MLRQVSNPIAIAEKLKQVVQAWRTLAPDRTLSNMSLAEFEALLAPSFEHRERIKQLQSELKAAQIARSDADKMSLGAVGRVAKSVVGDPDLGDDCQLYKAMGYILKSQRKSGLTRKRRDKIVAAPESS